MRKIIRRIVCLPLALALVLLTACKSESTYEADTSANCIVSAITMGTLNRTIAIKSSTGADSSYVSHVTGSLYPMTIDQIGGRIFNADSLPENTDARKVNFTSLAATGSMTLRSLTSGQDTLVSTKDTIDCSVPRLLTVQAADSTVWHLLGTNPDVAAATKQRALVKDDKLYLFVRTGGQDALLTARVDAPQTLLRTDLTNNAIDVRSIVLDGSGTFYALAAGSLVRSTDGVAWTSVPATLPAHLVTLPVAGTDRLVGIDDAGQFFSSRDGGLTWQPDEQDAMGIHSLGKTQGLCLPTASDATYEDLLVLGENGTSSVVWKRNIDLTGAVSYPWVFYPEQVNENYVAPLLTSAALARYDGGTLLVGLDGGKLAALRLSLDNGRTWDSTLVKKPAATATGSIALATTADSYIILFCGGTGEVWKGRINRLGWN